MCIYTECERGRPVSTMGRNQANVRKSAGAHSRLWYAMLVSEYMHQLVVLGVNSSSVHATLRSIQNCSKSSEFCCCFAVSTSWYKETLVILESSLLKKRISWKIIDE